MRQKVKRESCVCCHITIYNVFGYIRICSSGVIILSASLVGEDKQKSAHRNWPICDELEDERLNVLQIMAVKLVAA